MTTEPLASAPKTTVQAEGIPSYWYRDGFFLTNDKSHLDPRVINDSFGSELMWWNVKLELSEMRRMLDSCLTFGVYAVDSSEEEMKSTFLEDLLRKLTG